MGLLDTNAPLRLLRKAWSGPDELAQELYAMLSQKGPVEVRGPLVIRAPKGVTPLRIVADDGSPDPGPTFTFGAPGRAADPGPAPVRGNAFPGGVPPYDDGRVPRGPLASADPKARDPIRLEERRRDPTPPPPPPKRAPDPPSDRPTVVEFDGPFRFTSGPVYFDQAPLVYNDKAFLWHQVPVGAVDYPGGGGTAGTTTYIGRVVSGSGRAYQVTLLPNGAGGKPGDTVPVKCPALAVQEVCPAGMLLSPIFEFTTPADPATGDPGGTTYEAYPPIWIDGPSTASDGGAGS